MDDGTIELRVSHIEGDRVYCKVENSGLLWSSRGLHLPGCLLQLPIVSDSDRRDLELVKELQLDFVFASFVSSPEHVTTIRRIIGPNPGIIAKIESQSGTLNVDEILREADGLMVARGDLGVDIALENVFAAQKKLIATANLAGKPVICATQMLESMCVGIRPTRAECVDVANAVFDGCDAVMLSGETASGKYPAAATRMMDRICRQAEVLEDPWSVHDELTHIESTDRKNPWEALASAAAHASRKESAALIVVLQNCLFSRVGGTGALNAMVKELWERASRDKQLQRVFAQINTPAHQQDFANSLAKLLGGPPVPRNTRVNTPWPEFSDNSAIRLSLIADEILKHQGRSPSFVNDFLWCTNRLRRVFSALRRGEILDVGHTSRWPTDAHELNDAWHLPLHLVAKYRPVAQIVLLTHSEAEARLAMLLRGVTVLLTSPDMDITSMLNAAIRWGINTGVCSKGGAVVALYREPSGVFLNETHTMRVLRV